MRRHGVLSFPLLFRLLRRAGRFPAEELQEFRRGLDHGGDAGFLHLAFGGIAPAHADAGDPAA